MQPACLTREIFRLDSAGSNQTMRAKSTPTLLLSLLLLGRGWADDKATAARKDPEFSLPPVGGQAKSSRFSDDQLAYVQSWIKQLAPESPVEDSEVVAERFLDELRQRRPEQLDQLLTADFPSQTFESMLLRQVGGKLAGPTQGPLRELLARRRVAALLAAESSESDATAPAIDKLIAKMQETSPAQYRRLVEGRLEDDDLHYLLKKAGQAETAPKEAVIVPVKPKVLTAVDIVSEFSRRNQAGAALHRLQAYTVEGRLTTADGTEQDITLFKMRPDRFRLVVRSGGLTRYLLAGDGRQFWQQAPGKAAQVIPSSAIGVQRHLAEFIDPMFVGGGYGYERLEDGEEGGKIFHRVAVKRPDGSGYVARVDAESFREIARENEDKSVVRYSDFREVAGVTLAFHEEVSDEAGRQARFKISRISPNPGLIRDFFTLPADGEAGFFQLEQFSSPSVATTLPR